MVLFNNYIYYQYSPILIFALVCIILAVFLLSASLLIATQLKDSEKISAYECGFDPFNYKDIQTILNIRFYLVGILFIIFDIEIVFLYPWAMTLGSLGSFGYWSMTLFLFILTVGFVYEWKKGGLDWS
jgi:NADH-quinone oxidoreductase subunit A